MPRDFLAQLDLRPVIVHEQPSLGRTMIEKFEDYSNVDLAASNGGSESYRARQNVVFEMGYSIGKLGRNKVIALHEDGVELPSDINGVIYVNYDGPGAWKLELAKELRASGIEIDVNKVL